MTKVMLYNHLEKPRPFLRKLAARWASADLHTIKLEFQQVTKAEMSGRTRFVGELSHSTPVPQYTSPTVH